MKDHLTIAQAAKVIGVPTSSLRDMCDDGSVTATRGPAGHWYIPVAQIPSREEIQNRTLAQYAYVLGRAQAAADRLAREVEAIQLDIREATEDETHTAPLGNDINAAPESFGALNTAVADLRDAAIHVALVHRAVRQMHTEARP